MRDLELPQDYSDLLMELLDSAADFVVIGGWAVAVHGHARATNDLDILVRPTVQNAQRVYEALQRGARQSKPMGSQPSSSQRSATAIESASSPS
jgi:isocitrate lyase